MSKKTIEIDGPRLEPETGIKKLVIFLHGYGSNGEDLISLTEHFYKALPDTAFVGPHAPFACGMNPAGREWFPITSLSYEERRVGTMENHHHLDAFIDAQKQHYNIKDQDIVLIGFSQGTMMALYVAPRRAKPLAAVIGFSGALTCSETLKDETKSHPPILLIHGDKDEVVPFEELAKAQKDLENNGINVTTHTSKGMGHSIAPDGIKLASEFLVKHLL